MSYLEAKYKRELLSKHFLFETLSSKDIDSILAFSTDQRYHDGQTIFQKGDPGASLMAVLRGRIRISAASKDGKEIIFSVIESGQILGEIALLDGKERSADATALGDCVVLTINRRDFIPFLEKNPQIAVNLLGVLCDRLRNISTMVEDIVFLDLAPRLGRLLLRLAHTYGRKTSAGLHIELKLSQYDLGNLSATSRESINKQLRTWQKQGLIQINNGYITICRPDDMEKLCN
jgi:CRP/FNR family transcriptional regulator, cyclic AMP receptor protein